jgi:hypothetical protein
MVEMKFNSLNNRINRQSRMKWSRKVIAHFLVLVFAGLAASFPVLCAATSGTNDLWLEMTLTNSVAHTNFVVRTNSVVRTNNYVTLTYDAAAFAIHAPETNVNYIYNLTGTTNPVGLQDWTWWAQTIPGQTNLVVTNLPPEHYCFRLEVTNVIRPGFDQNYLDRNDDGSTEIVPIGFYINFYGNSNATLYVNNNGDVTFNNPISEYSPKTLASLGIEVIAPFWADVDTRNTDSDVVRYGTNTIDGSSAFGVNWVNVGYYSSKADKLLSCQLVIIDRSDIAPGDFDMEFNYNKVQWEWGDVTVGNPPRAGFANSSEASSYELGGSGVNGAFMDTNAVTGLIYNRLNSSLPGRYQFRFRDGNPLP